MGMMESIEKDPIVAFYLKMSKSTQMLGRLPIYSETILRLAFKQILNKFRVLETSEIHLYCKLLQLYYFDCYGDMDSMLMIFPHHSEEEIYDCVAEAETILAEWRLFTKNNLHIVAYKQAYMEILSEWCLRYVSVFRQVDKDALAWKTCELQSFLNSDIKFQKTWLRTLQNVIKTKDVWSRADWGEEGVTEDHLKISNIYRDIKNRLHPWVVENCALRRERPVKKATAFLVAPDYTDGGAASSSATAAVSDDESLYEAPPQRHKTATRPRQRTTNKRNHAATLNEQPPAAEGYVMYGEVNGEANAYVYGDDAAAAAQDDFIPLNKKTKLDRETESAERVPATTTTAPDYDYWERGYNVPARKKYNSNSCSSTGSTSSNNKTKCSQNHHPVDGEKKTATRANETATQKQQQQQQQKLKQQQQQLQRQKLKQQQLQKLKEQQKARQQQLHILKQQQKLKQLQQQQQKLKEQQLQKQQAQAKLTPPPIVLNNLIRKQGIRSGRLPPTADTACSVSSSSASPFPYNNNEHEVRRKPDRGHLPNHVNDIEMDAADGSEDMLIDADEDVGQGSYRSAPHKEQRPDYVEDDEDLDEEDKPQTETDTDIESESDEEEDEEDSEEEQEHVRKIHIEYEEDTLDEQEEDEEGAQEQEEDEDERQEQEEETQEGEEDEEDTQEREEDEEGVQQQQEDSPEQAEEEDEALEEVGTHDQKKPAEVIEENHEEILIEADLEESSDDETEDDGDSFDESNPEEIFDEADESNDEKQEVASRATTENGHTESFDEGHEEILEEVEIDERRVGEAGEILSETGENHEEATVVREDITENLHKAAESLDEAVESVDDAAGGLVDAGETLDEVDEVAESLDDGDVNLDEAEETLVDNEHTLVIDEDAPMIDPEDTVERDVENGRAAANLTASSERDTGYQVEVLTIVYESDTNYKPIEIEVVEPEEAADEEAYDIEYQSGSSDQEDARNQKACPHEDVEMKDSAQSAVGGDGCVKADFDEEDSQSHPEDTYEDVEYLFECLPDETMGPRVQEESPDDAHFSPETIPAPPPPSFCSEQSVEEMLATYEDIDYLLEDVAPRGKQVPTPQVCVAGESLINDLSVTQIIDDQIPLEPQHMVAVEQAALVEAEIRDFSEISVAADEYIFMDEEIVYEEESVVAEEEESLVQQIVATELIEASPEEQTIGQQETENMELEAVEELESVVQHEHEEEQEAAIQHEYEPEQESVVQHENEEEQDSVVQHENEEELDPVFQHEHMEMQESVIQHEDLVEQESALQHEDVEEQQTVGQHEDVMQQETDGQHESDEQLRAAVQERLAEHEQPVPQQETVVEQAAPEATEQEAFVQQQQDITEQESALLEQTQPAAAEQTEAEPEDSFSTFTRESVAEWKDGEMYKFVEGCMGMWKVALIAGGRKEAMSEVAADTAEKECAEDNVPPEVITAVEQKQQIDEAAQSKASPEGSAAEPTDDCVMYDRDVDVVNEVVVSGAKPDGEETPAPVEVDHLASGITINVDYSPMIEECFDADPPKATDTLLHEPFAELAAFRPVDHVDHQYVMQQQQQYSQKKRVTEPLHTRLLNISDYEDLEPSHRCLQIELDLLQVRIDEATQAIEAQSSSEDSNEGDSEKRGGATMTTTSNPSPDQSNESPGSQQCGDNSNDSRLHEPMSVDPMDIDPSASSSPQLEVHIYNEATTTPPSASKEEIDSNDSGGAGGGGAGGRQTHPFGSASSATSPPRSLSQGDKEAPTSAAREDDKTPAPSPEAAMAALFHPDGANEDDSDKHVTAGISDTPPSSSGSLHEPSKMELSLDFLISNTIEEPKFDAESLLAGGVSLGGSKRHDCSSRANDMLFGLGTLSTISAPHVYTSLHTTSTSTGTSTTTVMPLIPYFPALDSPATSPVSVAASATMQQVAPSQLSLMTSSYDELEPTAELPVVSYEPGETLQPMDVDELSVTKNVLSEGKIIKKISHGLAAKYVFQLRAYAIDNGHYAAMKLLDQIDRMFQGTY